ncbi:hypothetical protein PG985_003269 [Apiospora marii]|uniref:uncharacterized protein n=1 Tax=Apiospora marii TaxID=335849 RepID=UPI003130B9FA
MAGSRNLVIGGAQPKKEARDAYARQAKESLAFSRFLFLAKLASAAGLCRQDRRFVLAKFFLWLEPAGRANLAKFAGSAVGHVARTEGRDPTSLYEVREGGRDYALRKEILGTAVEEARRDPLGLYGAQGWFLDFVCWVRRGEPLELAVLDQAMYAILMAHQLLANPGLELPELVRGRVKQAWWAAFRMGSPKQMAACTCAPVAEEERGKAVYPDCREEETKVLTDLMDDVFARLSPPLSRLALCDPPRGKPKAVNEAGFQKRWNDLLDLMKLLGVKNKAMVQ